MFKPALIIASLLAVSAVATPISNVDERAPSDLETRAAPTNFKLKTTVIDGKNDTGSNKGNLWVYSYHTGAGLGDAALSSNKTWGDVGHINASNSALLFSIGEYEWPMALDYEPYAAWSSVEISVATNEVSTGFFINSTGLHNNYSSTAGWLACDWWHGTPQLFWTNGEINTPTGQFPTSCSTVKLDVVAA